MTTRLSGDEFLRNLRDSHLLSTEEAETGLQAGLTLPADGEAVARRLVSAGKLTPFQAEAVRERRFAELLIGNYEVLDRLGAGAMGTVYKARHRRMKRAVAIKVLSKEVAASGKFIQRFQREVEAVARLSHPNIVMAYDADEAEIGHYLVMELVNGRDLASEVDENGPLPVAEGVDCIVQAARGLDYAHGQGIIHRDIKPANLLRDVSGVVKVADLGLARVNDPLGRPPEEAAGLTQAGTIMGTVDFMPPEQAMGLTNIDPRADIYSLGCTLYYLLAGRPPYHGPTLMAVLLAHRDDPVPPLSAVWGEVPPGLDEIFRRMVAKKPQDRFASMAEVIRALEALALTPAAQPTRPRPQGPPAAVPIPATAATVEAPRGQAETAAAAARPDAGGLTALLVEPSRAQAVIVRKYLQDLGLRDVRTAPSGQAALEMARNAPPGVVVCAMHLADMTGAQLERKIRAEATLASTGFILITSQDDLQEADLVSQARHTVRLHKPFDQARLGQALAAVTGSRPARAAPSTAERAAALRVLVVDDSAAARAHVRGVLTGLGAVQIVEAGDGAEAVSVLEKQAFDLVVTDYNMPRLDGRELIDFLRHRSTTPNVPVILVTTETDPEKLEAVRRLGVSAICDKSVKPEVVRGVIKRLG